MYLVSSRPILWLRAPDEQRRGDYLGKTVQVREEPAAASANSV